MRRIYFLVFFVMFLFGCDKLLGTPGKPSQETKPPAGAVVVAKVGNFYITADDLNREVENYNAFMVAQGAPKNKIDSAEKKIAYLKDEVVRKYILYHEALNRKLERQPNIAKALEDTKVSLLVAELLREETEKINVSDKEVEDFYNQNKDLLKGPERRKVSEIVTKTEDEAKQVSIELLKGIDFASLAKQYSTAATAKDGGSVGVISYEFDPKKRIRSAQFYDVVFSPSLEKGNISSIFKIPEGFCIVKIEDIEKSEAKPLSELKENIKSGLLFEKQQAAISDLSNKLSGQVKTTTYDSKVE